MSFPDISMPGLGIYDALLDIVCAGQSALIHGRELAFVQIDFSAAFDSVSHSGILCKLRDMGAGCICF